MPSVEIIRWRILDRCLQRLTEPERPAMIALCVDWVGLDWADRARLSELVRAWSRLGPDGRAALSAEARRLADM